MRHLRPATISISLFLLFTLLAAQVRADENDIDEYEETARVARVSLLRGDVQLKRHGSSTWEQARVNFPLVEGDTLATTGQDSHLEIQIDARNFLRLGGDSVLRVVTLRHEGVALSLSEGTMSVRLARFEAEKEYFEIDAPGTTLAAEKRGLYRLDVAREANVRLTVRDGGRARIYSETSGFTLRDGRSAELVYQGTDAGDWELSSALAFDTWDTWVDERERYLATRLRHEGRDRYYDADVWGAEELDAYGDWTHTNDYGWVWRPHTTVINNYYNWAPYRHGNWTWCPPYGWTWVGHEPWGWAPYHYGRWVYYNNGWAWAPRGYGYSYKRAWWRPALVVFVYVPTRHGEHVAWYPLSHGQRDPRGRHYRRLQALRSNDITHLRRTHPAHLRAITTLPARAFGQRAAQTQPASEEIARRAVTAEPVRGRLPIAPIENSTGERERIPRVITARPTRRREGEPVLEDRPTGAGLPRTPGVALDNELRRTRLFNGREPRIAPGGGEREAGGASPGQIVPGDTGVVTRPARRVARPSIERDTQPGSGGANAPWYERPARPARRAEERPDSTTQQPPTGVERPARPAPTRQTEDVYTPSAPSAPTRVRPTRRNDDEPEARPERRAEPRREPQPENRPEPRYEPRPERRPEPRPETRPEPRPEPRPEQRPEPRPESRPDPPRQESRPEPRPEPRQERPRERPAAPARERGAEEERPS